MGVATTAGATGVGSVPVTKPLGAGSAVPALGPHVHEQPVGAHLYLLAGDGLEHVGAPLTYGGR